MESEQQILKNFPGRTENECDIVKLKENLITLTKHLNNKINKSDLFTMVICIHTYIHTFCTYVHFLTFLSGKDTYPGGGGGLPYETDGDARRLA